MSHHRTARLMTGLALTLALGLPTHRAAAATIVVDATTPDDIPGLTGFNTTGAMMSGMTVTAIFQTFVETLNWTATGGDSGGVFGTGWSLEATGDTFNVNAWSFTNSNAGVLTRLILDGRPGFTLFDRTNPSPGTAGSAQGRDFETNLAADASVVATYSRPVGVGGAAPVGDIFHMLDVDFAGLPAGGVQTDFLFSQDADNDSRFTQVPEPALMTLFGLGLLAGGRRVRRG
jgi:hypothetical protein